jgi:hypothetical protein
MGKGSGDLNMTSVFHRTDSISIRPAPAQPINLKVPSNLRGQTPHFAIYADPALGTDGQKDADVVVAKCEADYATISGYFSGLTPGPFSVILFSNASGAYHMTCAATDLFCDAKTNPADGNYSEFLNIAEFVEVFQAVQAAGWNCGMSNGEGLSRVLATDAYPGELDGFATAPSWLDSDRPNYVDRNFSSDTDSVANGCSVLFLNWLHFQLKYSWQQITAAGAPSVGQTYTTLTGKTDGFNQFTALINSHFPTGHSSGLLTDNPFPL